MNHNIRYQTKWGGRRDRTRVVLRPADKGGASCPQLVAAEPCSPHMYSWHVAPWDDCQPLGLETSLLNLFHVKTQFSWKLCASSEASLFT